MNARITKELAATIAVKLCEKKKAEITELENKMSFFITDIAKRKVPKNVYIAFESNPEYISACKRVYLNGEGISRYESHSLTENVPLNDEQRLSLSTKEAEKVVALKNKIKDLSVKYKALVCEVESALLACRTPKKVKELFPEAVPYLPKTYDPPALNFEATRKKIK